MVIRAYVLVRFEAGSGRQVINDLRRSKGVISADLVTGPYDNIVVIETADMNDVAEFVVNKVSSIPGVASTTNCLSLEVSN